MKLYINLVKTLESLKRKRFADALGTPEDFVMESEVAEHSSLGAQANWLAKESPNYRPLGVKKAKEELVNKKTREQVAHAQAPTSLEVGDQLVWMLKFCKTPMHKNFLESTLMPQWTLWHVSTTP